jgi:DNA primase
MGHEPYVGKLAIPYLTPTGVIDIRFRSLNSDGGPKYMSRPGATTHIYNINALSNDSDVLAICEGELDTVVATQAGFSAVGLPGANNWKSFYNRVLADWSKVVLLCDGDNAGREMAKHLSRELDNVFPVFMPEGQDVNDVYLTEGADGLRKRAGI